jgi:hypothetical protein
LLLHFRLFTSRRIDLRGSFRPHLIQSPIAGSPDCVELGLQSLVFVGDLLPQICILGRGGLERADRGGIRLESSITRRDFGGERVNDELGDF